MLKTIPLPPRIEPVSDPRAIQSLLARCARPGAAFKLTVETDLRGETVAFLERPVRRQAVQS